MIKINKNWHLIVCDVDTKEDGYDYQLLHSTCTSPSEDLGYPEDNGGYIPGFYNGWYLGKDDALEDYLSCRRCNAYMHVSTKNKIKFITDFEFKGDEVD